MYSVLILTKNEELALPGCLASVDSDDIWIVDSFSDDATIEIANQFDVNVVEKHFNNYSEQRNFGLSLPFKYDWILMLDADERVSFDMSTKLGGLLAGLGPDVEMVSVLRRDYFWGKWIRGASGYPIFFPRLFRKGRVRVEREINEIYICNGKNLRWNNYINHEPFLKGISYWIDRHNKYSSMEVIALEEGMIINSDKYFAKRQFLKSVFYRLPFRPLVMFFYLFFFKFGFLAGRAGFTFCILRSFYEFLIDCKRVELQRSRSGIDD